MGGQVGGLLLTVEQFNYPPSSIPPQEVVDEAGEGRDGDEGLEKLNDTLILPPMSFQQLT